jgi:hypothetical protein
MHKRTLLALAISAATGFTTSQALAAEGFNRIATYPIYKNLPSSISPDKKAVAEIVTATNNGTLLIYTDSKQEALGMVDLRNPAAPTGAGYVQLGGEPTSVTALGNFAYVGVNTSKSYKEPSGHVAIVDLTRGDVIARCDVQGQPDSVALSPDKKHLAIAVENERDEELNDGVIPQMPAGHLAHFHVDNNGALKNCDTVKIVDLRGLAEIAPEDPEPEFVAINNDNIAVVTLQENNHIALVDLAPGWFGGEAKVINHFSAGKTSLSKIDNSKDKSIHLDSEVKDVLREPDAVTWLDNNHFATADEGDYNGGSRTMTVFNTRGEVVFDSGNQLEHLAAQHGHFPEKRAHKKGTEPEGVASGRYRGKDYVFVGMERAGLMAVYQKAGDSMELIQGLPTGWRPEGILPIPERNLLVVANENDDPEEGLRSTLTIYEHGMGVFAYPQIYSANDLHDAPMGWGALSALAADPRDANTLFSVNDSFYKTADIYKIDVSGKTARIANKMRVMENGKAAKDLDLEGIAVDTDGSFWVVSEGAEAKKKKAGTQNRILHLDPNGHVMEEVALPLDLHAQMKKYGLEGIAVDGNKLVVAFQRAWNDDPKNHAKVGIYDRSSKAWGFYHYPLEKAENGWIGLSEITRVAPGRFWVIERDNQSGDTAAFKRIYEINLNTASPASLGSGIPVLSKRLVHDVLPDLQAQNGWTAEKLEGLAISTAGNAYVVTDNDGADDSNGETVFLNLGKLN